MLIGQVVKKTGFSKDTIRYYEKFGLISPGYRRKSNYKEYSEETVKKLFFIKQLKAVGFTLKEIKEMIVLFTDNSHTCETMMNIVSSKINQIDDKIAQLNQFKNKLFLTFETCESHSPQHLCPTFENIWDI